MYQVEAYLLENRAEVLAQATEMVKSSRTRVYGMGRDLAWLNDPEFRRAVASRQTKREGGELDMLVIAARRDRHAEEYACRFYHEIQAEVGFHSFGQVRVVVCDGERLLLGFPAAPGLRNAVNDVCFGLMMHDKELAEWLEKRFLNKFAESTRLGWGRLRNFRTWIKANTYSAIFSVLLAIVSFVLGLFARMLLR